MPKIKIKLNLKLNIKKNCALKYSAFQSRTLRYVVLCLSIEFLNICVYLFAITKYVYNFREKSIAFQAPCLLLKNMHENFMS